MIRGHEGFVQVFTTFATRRIAQTTAFTAAFQTIAAFAAARHATAAASDDAPDDR
jgi:hypothetical protein